MYETPVEPAELRRHVHRLKPTYPFCSSGVAGSFVASEAGSALAGVAKEARIRGFAAPAFAGCAFVELVGLEIQSGAGGVKPGRKVPMVGEGKESPR
jgi:hypothetical protein